MTDGPTARDERPKNDKTKATASAVLGDGSLVEMLYDPDAHRTALCVFKDGSFHSEAAVLENGERLVPYSPQNNLLAHEVVLFPSEPVEYGSETELVAEIRAFIHAHVDVSPLFETIASYYVLFSWVYDSFNELPYLRVRGDTGSGKTRCLLTIGSLCYKPIFASGASTVSPIFRIIDALQGTLIVDEGDFRFSDEKAEIIKILNNGNARGFPVLRSEAVNGGKEFDPKAYSVFGPKLIATRNYFEDRALETRCLTEETGGRKLRDDIPLNLPVDWKVQARGLRNKLLMFRFRNYGRHHLDPANIDRSIEPRLAQVFGPLLSVIADPAAQAALCDVAREYHQELITDRGSDMEAQVLEAIRDVLDKSDDGQASIKAVAGLFARRYGDEYDRKITAKWIGSIVRRSLQLKTQKSHGVFVIAPTQKPKLDRLYERYGLVDVGDGTNVQQQAGGLRDFGDL
jgi:hypothetical protein